LIIIFLNHLERNLEHIESVLHLMLKQYKSE